MFHGFVTKIEQLMELSQKKRIKINHSSVQQSIYCVASV